MDLSPEFKLSLAAALLFVLLSPGVLLTLPPTGCVSTPDPSNTCSTNAVFTQIWNNKNPSTNWVAVLVHAVVFALAFYLLLKYLKNSLMTSSALPTFGSIKRSFGY
jgi:hypothetical protein